MKGLTIGTACSLLAEEEVESGLLGSGRGGRLLGSRRGLAVARLEVVLEVGPAEQLVGLPQRVLVERVAEPVEEALLLAPVGGSARRGQSMLGRRHSQRSHAHRHRHRDWIVDCKELDEPEEQEELGGTGRTGRIGRIERNCDTIGWDWERV